MHAAHPRIGIQATIFSEREVFKDCCPFYPFDIFAKNGENNEKIMSFNSKIYHLHNLFSYQHYKRTNIMLNLI